jgi:hypothetical protein
MFDFTYRWAFTATVIWNSISDICGYLQFLERPEWQDSHRLDHDKVGEWLRARGFDNTRQDTERARSLIPLVRDDSIGSKSSWECDTICHFSQKNELIDEYRGDGDSSEENSLSKTSLISTRSSSEFDQEIMLESLEDDPPIAPPVSDMASLEDDPPIATQDPRISSIMATFQAGPPDFSPVSIITSSEDGPPVSTPHLRISSIMATFEAGPPDFSPASSIASSEDGPPISTPDPRISSILATLEAVPLVSNHQNNAESSSNFPEMDEGLNFKDLCIPCPSMSEASSGRLACRLRKKNLRCHSHYPRMLVINRLASPVDSIKGFTLEKRGPRTTIERSKRSRWAFNPFNGFCLLDVDHYKCLISRAWKAYCEPHIKAKRNESKEDGRTRLLKTGDRVRKIFSALVISRNSSSRIKIDGNWQKCGQAFPDMTWRTQDLNLTAEKQIDYDSQENATLENSVERLVKKWSIPAKANKENETGIEKTAVGNLKRRKPKNIESKVPDSSNPSIKLDGPIRLDDLENMFNQVNTAANDDTSESENSDIKNDSTYKALLTPATHLNSGALFDMNLKVVDHSLAGIVDRFRSGGRIPPALMDILPDTDEKLLQQALYGSPKLRCFVRQVEHICYSERGRKKKIVGWFMYPDTMYLCQKVGFF